MGDLAGGERACYRHLSNPNTGSASLPGRLLYVAKQASIRRNTCQVVLEVAPETGHHVLFGERRVGAIRFDT